MPRPACVVRAVELPGEARPRFTPGGGTVRSEVRAIGNTTGLTRMGVWHRTVPPGFAGTHRHFHEVEEEWTYVLAGEGAVRIGPHRFPVRAGSFAAFPPGPRPHHFINTGSEPLVLLEGGERRPKEDSGWYVDVPRRWEPGRFVDAPGPPPPEEGDPSQLVHLDEVDSIAFQHPVDPGARRVLRSLTRAAAGAGGHALWRQAFRWARVSDGDRSTAHHTHERTDEWVYILAGRARVCVGDERFEVEAGDFLGHPAGGPAHHMEPVGDLEYLMGGMVDPADVVLYPEAGLQRVGEKLLPLGKRGA